MHETKEKILTIAFYHFIRKPYIEVTMSEILKASGLSKGGFYHHFESKEVLYHEVIDHFILKTFMLEASHFTSKPYDLHFSEFIPVYIKETLGHLFELAASNLSDYNLKMEDVNLYMILFDMMRHYKGFSNVIDNLHKNEVAMFQALIEKSKEKGEIRKDLNSVALANHIHTLMHGIYVLSILEEGTENMDKIISSHFENLYSLIKT